VQSLQDGYPPQVPGWSWTTEMHGEIGKIFCPHTHFVCFVDIWLILEIKCGTKQVFSVHLLLRLINVCLRSTSPLPI